jgi:hypothetical protein
VADELEARYYLRAWDLLFSTAEFISSERTRQRLEERQRRETAIKPLKMYG